MSISIQSKNYTLAFMTLTFLFFTLLQIAANPYVAILGPQKSASLRLNMAQGFSSLGTIAPVLGGYLIFTFFKDSSGALLPILMGLIADNFGVQMSFIIPIFSYIYIAFYGISRYKSKKIN